MGRVALATLDASWRSNRSQGFPLRDEELLPACAVVPKTCGAANFEEDIMTRNISLVLAAATLLAFATNSAQAAETKNRLATNRLATNRIATNRLATNRLATNAPSPNRLEANMATAELLATADGRDVYSYLISCALPDNMTIQATIPSAPDTAPPTTNYTCRNGLCVFSGSLGLAEDWIDHRLA